ncbi:MAG: hypothetical protein HKN22_01220 [Bacteroidia bacterium]|nr:hypothetical protein [Bacteroidia bacterium]
MKRTFFLLAICMFCVTFIYAQGPFSAGMWCMGLGAAIHSDSDDNDFASPNQFSSFQSESTEFTDNKTKISLGSRYFVTPNIATGLEVSYRKDKEEEIVKQNYMDPFSMQAWTENTSMLTTTSRTMIASTTQWYSNNPGSVGLLAGLHAGYTFGTHEDENGFNSTNPSFPVSNDGVTEYKVSGFEISACPGLYVRLCDHLFLEVMAGGIQYHSINYDFDTASNNGIVQDIPGYKDDDSDSGFWFDFNPRRYTFTLACYFGGTTTGGLMSANK